MKKITLQNYETSASVIIRLTDFEHNVLYQSNENEMIKNSNSIDVAFKYDGKPLEVQGDVLIHVFKKGQVNTVELFHFWINTRFVNDLEGVTLIKTDIDGIHRDTKKYSKEFKINCQFDTVGVLDHDPLEERREEFLRRARDTNVKVEKPTTDDVESPVEIAVSVSKGGQTSNYLLEVDRNSVTTTWENVVEQNTEGENGSEPDVEKIETADTVDE